MKNINLIDIYNITYLFIPILFISYLYYRWVHDIKTVGYALSRMILQLIFIGYLLVYIFSANSSWIVILTLTVMLVVASSISIRTLNVKDKIVYFYALISILVSVILNLALVTQLVLHISPWYNPTYTIPLAGMLYSTSINAISLASERYESEKEKGNDYEHIRAVSYKTALIPIINSLFAVGIVTLPGMMTGQILLGVDPLIAVRYQIVVMLMLFSSAGLSGAIYLSLLGIKER